MRHRRSGEQRRTYHDDRDPIAEISEIGYGVDPGANHPDPCRERARFVHRCYSKPSLIRELGSSRVLEDVSVAAWRRDLGPGVAQLALLHERCSDRTEMDLGLDLCYLRVLWCKEKLYSIPNRNKKYF